MESGKQTTISNTPSVLQPGLLLEVALALKYYPPYDRLQHQSKEKLLREAVVSLSTAGLQWLLLDIWLGSLFENCEVVVR